MGFTHFSTCQFVAGWSKGEGGEISSWTNIFNPVLEHEVWIYLFWGLEERKWSQFDMKWRLDHTSSHSNRNIAPPSGGSRFSVTGHQPDLISLFQENWSSLSICRVFKGSMQRGAGKVPAPSPLYLNCPCVCTTAHELRKSKRLQRWHQEKMQK